MKKFRMDQFVEVVLLPHEPMGIYSKVMPKESSVGAMHE